MSQTMIPSALSTMSTVAELVGHLGGVPLDRIRLWPAPGTATEEDILGIHERERRLFELVEGVLVEKAIGFYESYLAGILLQLVNNHLQVHNDGVAAGESGMVRLSSGLVRIPDVSFIRWDRLPGRRLPVDPILGLAPDLAVEVLSKSNTKSEMDRKLDEYFRVGVRVVWFLDPRNRTLTAYESREKRAVYSERDRVSGGDVLPGFVLSLEDFFRRADREAPRE